MRLANSGGVYPVLAFFLGNYGEPSPAFELSVSQLRKILLLPNHEWKGALEAMKPTTPGELKIDVVDLKKQVCRKLSLIRRIDFEEEEIAWHHLHLGGPEEDLSMETRRVGIENLYLDPSEARPVKATSLSHKEAWYVAKAARHDAYAKATGDRLDRYQSEKLSAWLHSTARGKIYDRTVFTLEREVFEGLLQNMINSFELEKPAAIMLATRTSRLRAISEARTAWYYALEDKDSTDKEMNKAFEKYLKFWRPAEYETRDLFLKGLDLSTVQYIMDQLVPALKLEKEDVNFKDALRFWNLYHDDSIPVKRVHEEVRSRLNHIKQPQSGPYSDEAFDRRCYYRAQELLEHAELIRMRTQARIIFWLPWASREIFKDDFNPKNNRLLNAARMFLIVRKDLDNVLTYPKTEIEIFKRQLIEFLGEKQYDARIHQLRETSDALRDMMFIRKVYYEELQSGPQKHRAFEIRSRFDSIMRKELLNSKNLLDTQNFFLEHIPALPSLNRRDAVLGRLNSQASSYREDVVLKALALGQLTPGLLSREAWEWFELFDDVRSKTPATEWQTTIDELIKRKSIARTEEEYRAKLANFEADGKASGKIVHWEASIKSMKAYMKPEFTRPLDEIAQDLGLALNSPRKVEPLTPDRRERLAVLLQSTPHHYLPRRTVEAILGSDFLRERLADLGLTGNDFHPISTASGGNFEHLFAQGSIFTQHFGG